MRVSSPEGAPRTAGTGTRCQRQDKGGERRGGGGRPAPGRASLATAKPETRKRWRGGKGVPAGARPATTWGAAFGGRGWTTARGNRGVCGQRRHGAKGCQDGVGRDSEPGGRRRTVSGAAASAASPLPGMSEEPPRRLPSILSSAASPTALGGGHADRPGSPPSRPGASSREPSPAPRSSAAATRARGRLNSDSRCCRLSACRQPPRRARDHTPAGIGCLAPGPSDVSASLIRRFRRLPTEGGGPSNCTVSRRR